MKLRSNVMPYFTFVDFDVCVCMIRKLTKIAYDITKLQLNYLPIIAKKACVAT